jgi:hypothetical protein
MVAADRGQPRQGTRQGQAVKRPDPPSSGGAHACEDTSENVETPTFQAYSITRPFVAIDDSAKPGQHGHGSCGLGYRSARTFSRQAFLVIYHAAQRPDNHLA